MTRAACPFCNLSSQRTLWHECERFLAFESKRKVADVHLLLIPKAHVLQAEGMRDLQLIRELTTVGKQIKLPFPHHEPRFFIHPPPFHSVNHFHLHLFAGNYINTYQRVVHEYFARRVLC